MNADMSAGKEELKVCYKRRELEKRYIPDLFVFDRIVVELKAASAIAPEHEAQLMNYLRITRSTIGYLINFGPIGKLQYKRFTLSEFLQNDSHSSAVISGSFPVHPRGTSANAEDYIPRPGTFPSEPGNCPAGELVLKATAT